MQKILKVAQREYLETAKTKAFIFMIVMLPVMIAFIVFFTRRLNQSKQTLDRPAMRVGVTDLTGKLSDGINRAFDEHNTKYPNRQILVMEVEDAENSGQIEDQGKSKLRREELDAYVVLDKDTLDGNGGIHLYIYKPKPADIDAFWAVRDPLRTAIVNERCKLHNLSPELLESIRDVPVEDVDVGLTETDERVQTKDDRVIRMMVPFFFMYLLFLGIMTMGQQMLSSIIEEKSSRVIEVLLAAVSPFELMAGKILGLVGISITVVSLWGFAAYGAARWQGLTIGIAPEILPYFVVYFLLAFLLFSSIMVGIGSVCNTIKETQSLMTPVMLLCVVPLLAWQNIIQDPGGALARFLSFFPPTTPMVMILRLAAEGDVPTVEIVASMVLLAAAVLAMTWVAAKVFRTGILMYGKRPGLREVGRWLRQA
ncbi:MAG: ABC transporter permease [Planctomycetota bacterium]